MMDQDLDGTPEEFPYRQEAMNLYRKCWEGFLMSRDPKVQADLAHTMDEEQLRICRGPGPLWTSFTETLPGFNEFWLRFYEEGEEKIETISEP